MSAPRPWLLWLLCIAVTSTTTARAPIGKTFSTFTIVARDAATGDLGVASCSRAQAVGAVVPWVRAGVGAVAAQAWADAGIGPRALDLLAGGLAPREALTSLLELTGDVERRQIGMVGASGSALSHTGRQTLAYAGAIEDVDVVVLGNLLAGRETLEAMRASFRSTEGKGLPLAERLLRALEAGQAAGGDRRGSLSAALMTAGQGVGQAVERAVNLRVDDHDQPVEELRRIYEASLGRLGYRRLARPAGRDVVELQRLLKRAGFFEREPDGQFDDQTVAAVQAFRKAQGMYAGVQDTETGLVDPDLILRLHAWIDRPAAGSTKKPGE